MNPKAIAAGFTATTNINWVREGGVEPPHPFKYTDLNRARLPIPPLARKALRLAQGEYPPAYGHAARSLSSRAQ